MTNDPTDTMRFSWITSTETRSSVVEALNEAGADVEKRTGFEPLTIIAFAAGAAALARVAYALFRDATVRGVLIDATKDPIEVREMPGWERAKVLVLTSSGPVFHDFAEGASEVDIAAVIEGLSAVS